MAILLEKRNNLEDPWKFFTLQGFSRASIELKSPGFSSMTFAAHLFQNNPKTDAVEVYGLRTRTKVRLKSLAPGESWNGTVWSENTSSGYIWGRITNFDVSWLPHIYCPACSQAFTPFELEYHLNRHTIYEAVRYGVGYGEIWRDVVLDIEEYINSGIASGIAQLGLTRLLRRLLERAVTAQLSEASMQN
ncbi:hypothetical protein EPO04_00995 [Patescibacteria group bacterium]|nr:MAG: hypothetical protein EPO04_00995 [Patescibacteria group bacterium]